METKDLKIGGFYYNIELSSHFPKFIQLNYVRENNVDIINIKLEEFIKEKLQFPDEGYQVITPSLSYFLTLYEPKYIIYGDIYSNLNRLKLIED